MIRKIVTVILLFGSLTASGQRKTFSWSIDPVDGHRTGVRASNASDVEDAMGCIKGCTYRAPNGKKFHGSTKKVARIMLAAQPEMAKVKQVIAHSTRLMVREYPECELYDWYVDELMRAVQDSSGRKVDIGFANRGGVRIDMPQGDVLFDDIMSMFPFKNKICYVALHGRDVKVLLDQMAERTFQIVGGVKVVAKNGKILSATIGGEPVDDEKVYGVATLDFLLDGGDGYHVGKNAVEVIKAKGYLYDTILSHVGSLTAAGKPVEFEKRDWITILKEGEDHE